ncbi:MAG: HD domain-containing protein [Phycisphaerae bacterium]
MAEDKVIRDPVHNYIPVDSFTRKLLDTPEVQRLRYISQLGVSSFAYPGACHTRLSHAIGTYHLMNAAIRHLEKDPIASKQLNKHCQKTLRAAALLHDIGHAPFSHLLESTFGGNHEDRTCQIIRDTNTQLGALLAGEGLADDVANLIDKEDSSHPLWMKSLLSSQLDVDRMDYLLRDSHFTGAGYGRFDSYRLINTMELTREAEHEEQEALLHPTWPRKAIIALEEYIFARYYMYSAVYYHKTTRGYEKLLQAVLDRAAKLARDDDCPPCEPDMELLLGGDVPNDRFCRMSDSTVLSALHRWLDTPDRVLSDLCRRFLHRDGFKSISVTPRKVSLVSDNRRTEIHTYMESLDTCYSESVQSYVLHDKGGIEPYYPYKWGVPQKTFNQYSYCPTKNPRTLLTNSPACRQLHKQAYSRDTTALLNVLIA